MYLVWLFQTSIMFESHRRGLEKDTLSWKLNTSVTKEMWGIKNQVVDM